MATMTHVESRRLYSWWWDSHISPKNSKWLQENLTDMDMKLKSMIKLIEEDADSFAKRAEMYYKKRPELMKLVEEFYRAYRALAERYDHATGALRQAHRTMAEAFPNQIPFAVIDDFPSSSTAAECEPHTPEMSPPAQAFSEIDDLQKDSLRQSAYFHAKKKDGTYSEENDALTSKRRVKQLNEMFASGESTSHPKFAEGKIRKGLNFQGGKGQVTEDKINNVSRYMKKNEVGNKEDVFVKTRSLQDEVSKPSTENQNLTQVKSELDIVDQAESEIHRLQESLSRLETEKEAAQLQYHKSMENISYLEMEISHAQADNRKLKSEMLITLARLEMKKQALEMEVIDLAQQTNKKQQEVEKQDEMKKLKCSVQDEQVQYTQAAAVLQSLEKLHSESLEKLKISATEIQSQVEMLRDMELRKHGLEDGMQQVKGVNGSLKNELKLTQEELERLNVSIQDERLLSVQAEEALGSLQKLHSQSQQEIKFLMFDLQSKVEMLKGMELTKHNLEEEIQQLNQKNENLNNQVLSSTLMIKNLQQEILSLKETELNLENKVKHHLHGYKALQQEVHYLKEEIANLDLKHQCVMEQIEAVGLNKESFQASINELQDGNLELKEMCKQHEDENAVLLEELENMETVTEKNTVLEATLSDATFQIQGLREKVKALEESYESLNRKISALISENGSLIFELETLLKNMERLSENNSFLQNSLSEANVELEGLREKLKSLEESTQRLLNENSNLHSEKSTLVLQVENIGTSLGNMKRNYAELEDKHLYLGQERESTLLLVSELQNLLKLDKQQHEAFVLSSKNQLATFADKINILQEESQIKDKDLQSLQHQLINCQIEAFVLQRCLLDSKEKSTCLGKECEKHLVASRLSENLLSKLEKENLGQEKMIASISEDNKKLREAILMAWNFLGIKSACMSDGTVHEADCQHIFSQIVEMQNFLHNTLDENHILLLEKLVNITFLQQLGHQITVLNSEKNAVSLQYRTVNEHLLALKSEKNELLQINEKLTQDFFASDLREDNLKSEVDNLGKQKFDLIECQKKLQVENCNLVEEKQILKKNVLKLRNEIQLLEEENNALFAEVVNLNFLSLTLQKFCAERARDLRACSSDLCSLHDINNNLEKKVAQMIQKIGVIEAENMILKDSAIKLEDCQDRLLILQDDMDMTRNVHGQLNHQIEQLCSEIETEKSLMIQKDLELIEAKQKLKVTEYENMKLYKDLEGINTKFDEAMHVRKELEERICTLIESNLHKDKEIANMQEANQMSSTDINTLQKKLVMLTTDKEHLISELTYEMRNYEQEVARLWNDIHFSSVHVGIFEEKILELIGECESLEIIATVQRKTLEEQIILHNACFDELKQKLKPLESESESLKAQLNACLPLVFSLESSSAALEHQILSLVKHHGMDYDSTHDSPMARHEHGKSFQGPHGLFEDANKTEVDPFLRLQKLQVRVEALHKVLVEHWDILNQENPKVNPKSEAVKIDINVLTPEESLGEEEVQAKSCSIMEIEENVRETSKHPELQSGGAESSNRTDGLMMKDIQLDHASYAVRSGLNKRDRVKNAENDHQMPKLWETAESDLNNQVSMAPSVTTDEDMDFHQTEAVGEDMAQHLSKLVAEKEVGVDKLKVPRKVKDSHRDWNRKLLECLASDAHRLSILQKSVQELKRMLENSEKSGPSTNMKYDTVKQQLKETEETISHLFDINSKLTKKTEGCHAPGSQIGEQDEVSNQRRRVSECARRGSEKIGQMELELQRIQYTFLKLEAERENRTKAADGKSKVMLKDYLYGRRESYRRKKGHFFACVEPKTVGD